MSCAANYSLFNFYVESDNDEEYMFVWAYPSVDTNTKNLILKKCEILSKEHPGNDFCFNQTNKKWYYIKKCDIKASASKYVS